jgi:hypothetical protein
MKIKCICCGKKFEAGTKYIILGRATGKTFLRIKNLYEEMCCSEECKKKIEKALEEIFLGGFENDKGKENSL